MLKGIYLTDDDDRLNVGPNSLVHAAAYSTLNKLLVVFFKYITRRRTKLSEDSEP